MLFLTQLQQPRCLIQASKASLDALTLDFEAKRKEAEEDSEGVGTIDGVFPGEAYDNSREWLSEDCLRSAADLRACVEKVKEITAIRALAREREVTVGEMVLGAARGLPLPPHPDQWLPRAERERHEEEVRLLIDLHLRELRSKQDSVEAAAMEVREARRAAGILRARLDALEGWRDSELASLRKAGQDAVHVLKETLNVQRAEATAQIDRLEGALADVRREYNQVRKDLTDQIEELSKGRKTREAWIEALRHDLTLETAYRKDAESILAKRTDAWRWTSEKIKTELRAERMRGKRLELWVYGLVEEVHYQEGKQAEMKRQWEAERQVIERERREERHQLWRQRTAMRLLCTDVDSLFLFFTQRVANLAGARKEHNDDLRMNGAIEVLAAMCSISRRKEIRRLAARSLAGLGWNGHVEARVLAWDIHRNWDLWVERCCPAEEERLRRLGRTFEDSEQHSDKPVSFLVPPSVAPMSGQADCVSRSESEAVGNGVGGQLSRDKETERGDGILTIDRDEGEKEGGAMVSGEGSGGGNQEEDDEFRPTESLRAGEVVRARRQWALRRARRKEGPNEANQRQLGGFEGGDNTPESGGRMGAVLSMLVGSSCTPNGRRKWSCGIPSGFTYSSLCFESEDWEVVRAAVSALSVAANLDLNAQTMGRDPRCIEGLVGLLSNPDVEIQAHAAATLTNVSQGSQLNQETIGNAGGVEALLLVCQGRAAAREENNGGPPPSSIDLHGQQVAVGGMKIEGGNDEVGPKSGKEAVKIPRTEQQKGGQQIQCSVEDGGERMDVDALEAATAALANLMCSHEGTAIRFVDAGGIGVLMGLMSSFRATNLLDSDQVEEIHANAAEALANATRNYGKACAARIHALGVDNLILLCGSDNLQVRRHAALIIGNISQSEDHRSAMGQEGAVEALFVLCESEDDMVRANSLWALGNLAWDPNNQERIGRYIPELFPLSSSNWLPVRTNALICLANALYYHEKNRKRLEAVDGALPALIGFSGDEHSHPIQEAALRCMVSLSYDNHIKTLLVEASCIPILVARLSSPSTEIQQLAAMTVLNIALSDDHKRPVVDAGGVEAAVMLLGMDSPEVRELASKILAALAATGGDSRAEGEKKIGAREILGMLGMEDNVTAQRMAAEKLAEDVWREQSKQSELGELGGVETLLKVSTSGAEPELVIPALWGLRNSLHSHQRNKDCIVRVGGLEALLKLCKTARETGEWGVAEATLTVLTTSALGSERICRRLLKVGLDEHLAAAEDTENTAAVGGVGAPPHLSQRGKTSSPVTGGTPRPQMRTAIPNGGAGVGVPAGAIHRRGPAADMELGIDLIDEVGVEGVLRKGSEALDVAMKGDSRVTCSALATSLLQTLGPFNYVVCDNCGERESGGTTCSQCGHGISFQL
ncbi:unnamed protein product [Discosporangium mesarthrocarpum]